MLFISPVSGHTDMMIIKVMLETFIPELVGICPPFHNTISWTWTSHTDISLVNLVCVFKKPTWQKSMFSKIICPCRQGLCNAAFSSHRESQQKWGQTVQKLKKTETKYSKEKLNLWGMVLANYTFFSKPCSYSPGILEYNDHCILLHWQCSLYRSTIASFMHTTVSW